MCGILCCVTADETSTHPPEDEYLLDRIEKRGPDFLHTVHTHVHNHTISFTSSVLHLRGTSVVAQPILGRTEDVLCWNGEGWYGLGITDADNDTTALCHLLGKPGAQILDVFRNIRGPYAFVYYQAEVAKLWYARDVLGRRSLLSRQTSDTLTLCSVASRDTSGWNEVGTTGIYCYDLRTRTTSLHRWSSMPAIEDIPQLPYTKVETEVPAAAADTTDRTQEIYIEAVNRFHENLLEAVRVRAVTIPHLAKPAADSSRVAVMYSGGVDCAVIARLLHDVLPLSEPILLLNVSFENPRTIANAQKLDPTFTGTYETPDRLTGLQGYRELVSQCSGREWRFVSIDVPYAEAVAAKEDVLALMYPNDSIMDYSIALAFYFCARGHGTMQSNVQGARPMPYHTPARVYFSGLGADEQLGGYSRHLNASRTGWPALIEELQHDLDRIPTRNLGRDDRILSNFAREVRWPFLDEHVVQYLSFLRVDVKMTFDMPGGDKIILRDVARKLGIPLAAGEKKRAIQFGSRSARMELEVGNRIKGHEKQR